ncbi:MAG: nucleoside hydrolase [Cyclobacteriaceae bacterium]|nr:nucleoside hydrolase [Cyclobacteriaceae bacterium]
MFISCKDNPPPVAIILDTDIAPDYDDVGALAMLHSFADNNEAEILATISSNAFITTAPTLSVFNTYFNRPEIPVGVIKDTQPYIDCPRLWAEQIVAKYPHSIKSNEEAMDAVRLYRKVLSSHPDTSVTIVTIGFFSNLANLLNSQSDEFSSLSGQQLVKRKVKRLISMAGGIDSTGVGGYEWNIMMDIPASQKVFNDWPTPITLSGFEIGVNILTGMRLINNASIENSPVKDAYDISITYDSTEDGRYSWDQTAVLVAVRGISPYFNYRKLDLTIKDDGKDSVIAGNRITYLVAKQNSVQLEKIIEELMMHQY